MDPTLAGFLAFVQTVMQIPAAALPATSPYPALAYNLAVNLVNTQIQFVPNADPTQPTLYALAVYNLAGDRLIRLAQDVPPSTYFAATRGSMGIGKAFVAGVVAGASDNGTSSTLAVPDALKELTLADLAALQTPWGQAYLAIAQAVGPSAWGLS